MKAFFFSTRNRLIERLRSKALFVLMIGSALLGFAVPWGLGTEYAQRTITMQFLLCSWLMAVYVAVGLCRVLKYLATECRHGMSSIRMVIVAMASFVPEIFVVAIIMSQGLFTAPTFTRQIDVVAQKMVGSPENRPHWVSPHLSEIRPLIPEMTADIAGLGIWANSCIPFEKSTTNLAPNYIMQKLGCPVSTNTFLGQYRSQIFFGMILAGVTGCAIGAIFVGVLQRNERVLSGLTVFYGIALLFSPVVLEHSSWLLPLQSEWLVFRGVYPGNCPEEIPVGLALKYLISMIFPSRWLWTIGTFPFQSVSEIILELLYPFLVGIAGAVTLAFRLKELSKQIRVA